MYKSSNWSSVYSILIPNISFTIEFVLSQLLSNETNISDSSFGYSKFKRFSNLFL
ncbi:hypothetical protein [Petrotoga sp. 9PW.55.5.1]|uniref:hypothetical protein n=1 Tax=Petrotoga sp. 9PW.55.5.1 TaxID=1308979 RepID=UPI001F371A19|nr:hypothetical protein [Petrotoga sp. 9PW.55.5.1]